MSMKRTWAISSWISFLSSVDISRMPLGINRERHGKTERDCVNRARQHPFAPLTDGHDRCSDLEDKPGNDCAAQRETINLPLFQLTEERVHFDPRCLRSIGYSSR